MKTMILAAVAALSLGVGSAYAAGGAGPVGYEEPHYGAQAFSDHQNEAQTQFLGSNTVLGKMFRYNSNTSGEVAATATSAKGG
jgi:hypothetical protein